MKGRRNHSPRVNNRLHRYNIIIRCPKKKKRMTTFDGRDNEKYIHAIRWGREKSDRVKIAKMRLIRV